MFYYSLLLSCTVQYYGLAKSISTIITCSEYWHKSSGLVSPPCYVNPTSGCSYPYTHLVMYSGCFLANQMFLVLFHEPMSVFLDTHVPHWKSAFLDLDHYIIVIAHFFVVMWNHCLSICLIAVNHYQCFRNS